MTGNEIYEQALMRLGYTDAPQLRARALPAINHIYADLRYCLSQESFSPLKALGDEILLPERAVYDIMPSGVAAFIAQGEADGELQQLWISIYNRKRAAMTRFEKRKITD